MLIASSTITYRCLFCCQEYQWNERCSCNQVAPFAPAKSKEEPEVSLIDEKQVELLDGYRAARDLAARHAQSKADRAELMRIQAEALDKEAIELVNEINEGTPLPAGR